MPVARKTGKLVRLIYRSNLRAAPDEALRPAYNATTKENGWCSVRMEEFLPNFYGIHRIPMPLLDAI